MNPLAPFKRAKGLGRRLQQSKSFMNALSSLAARYIRFVRTTSKMYREPADTDAKLLQYHPSIVAMWHGQFLLLPHIKPKTMPVSDMVAKHSDGEMIARTLVRFDMGLIRGRARARRERTAAARGLSGQRSRLCARTSRSR